jgi:tetratricopeptide (TPR) repeat protein
MQATMSLKQRVLSVICLLGAFYAVVFASQPSSESPEQHARRYLALVEEAAAHRLGADAGKWTARVEEQHADIQRALAWTLQHAPDEEVVRFATAVGLLWERSHPQEAREAVEDVLQRAKAAPATVERAELLHRAGVLAFRQNDTATARMRMETSLTIARQVNDARATALALTGLAQVALREDPAKVFAYADEAIALYRQLNDLHGAGAPLHMKAEAARMMMDPRAEQMYEQTLALSRELKDSRRIATELHNLAYVKLQKKKSGEADKLFRESWTMFRELSVGDMDPYILGGLASVAAAEGRAERAAQLFGASDQLFETMKAAPDPADKVEMERYSKVAKSRLGEAAYETAYQKGRSLSTAAAVELAQAR